MGGGEGDNGKGNELNGNTIQPRQLQRRRLADLKSPSFEPISSGEGEGLFRLLATPILKITTGDLTAGTAQLPDEEKMPGTPPQGHNSPSGFNILDSPPHPTSIQCRSPPESPTMPLPTGIHPNSSPRLASTCIDLSTPRFTIDRARTPHAINTDDTDKTLVNSQIGQSPSYPAGRARLQRGHSTSLTNLSSSPDSLHASPNSFHTLARLRLRKSSGGGSSDLSRIALYPMDPSIAEIDSDGFTDNSHNRSSSAHRSYLPPSPMPVPSPMPPPPQIPSQLAWRILLLFALIIFTVEVYRQYIVY